MLRDSARRLRGNRSNFTHEHWIQFVDVRRPPFDRQNMFEYARYFYKKSFGHEFVNGFIAKVVIFTLFTTRHATEQSCNGSPTNKERRHATRNSPTPSHPHIICQ